MAIWRQRAQFSLSSLYVCRKDLTAAARFYCTVNAQKNYGSPSLIVNADGTLTVTYTTGTSNAGDVFARNGSDLYVTSEEDYTLTEGALCVAADNLPCALTSSVMVYRSWPTKETSFAYNEDGLRVQKTVTVGDEVTVTDYTLHGKLVTGLTVTKTCSGEIVDTQELHFFYDAQRRPTAVNHNGKWYTYIHNLQGDIVAILDTAGVKVVEYKYDAWGRPLGINGTLRIAELNPFRYRGYVWDEETSLYYLRSRYYDAEIGRFVKADNYIVPLTIETGITNSFSYCSNNAVIKEDESGHFERIAADSIVNNQLTRIRSTYYAIANIVFTIMHWNITRIMFGNYLYGNGRVLSKPTRKMIAETICHSQDFKSALLEIIQNTPKNQWEGLIQMEFKTEDLYYSFQHVAIHTEWQREGNQITGTASFVDKYDFTLRTSKQEKSFFKRNVNNLGYDLQQNGVGKDYYTHIRFDYSFSLGDLLT